VKAVNSYTAVIPAAGIGSRMQANVPKQYLKVAGKTVLEHTISALLSHSHIQSVVVVLHPNDTQFSTLNCASDPQVMTCVGGESILS
jgi:2-C-methyl-D-erythritol 4-phosphate cytidylyltransferase